MIRVSDCSGSKEFRPLLIRAGLSVRLRPLKQMPFADFWFWGNGPDGRCRVGIERKTLSEIAGCLAGDDRLTGHQLPGMTAAYDYRFLIVEGDRYIDPASLLIAPQLLSRQRKTVLYRTFQKYELTLALTWGIRIIPTKNKTHTALAVEALYAWFNDKKWHQHTSGRKVEEDKPDQALLEQRTMKRKVANQLTGLSWQRSLKVDAYFGSITDMVNANPEEWQRALGFKAGKVVAQRLYDVCHRMDDVPEKGR